MKKLFFAVLLLTIFQGLVADTVKKVKKTPISASMKHVLENVSSGLVNNLVDQKDLLSHCLVVIKEFQYQAKTILEKRIVAVTDVHNLGMLVESMKNLLVHSDCLQSSKNHELLEKLSIATITELDLLNISGIDQDVKYMKESLQELYGNYTERKEVDKKMSLRLLAIIEELFNRYDGVLISAYTVIVLSQVALNVFLITVA